MERVQITKHFADEIYLYRLKKNGGEAPFHRNKSTDYILEMAKHDYTGFDQMEAQTSWHSLKHIGLSNWY